MRYVSLLTLAAAMIWVLGPLSDATAQQKEEATFIELVSQKEFPVKATFSMDDTTYELTATGAVFVERETPDGDKIPMYSIVHYMADFKPDPFGDIYEQVIHEKVPKQLNLEFIRDMKKERLHIVINRMFQKAIRNYEIDTTRIRNAMQEFIRFFARDYTKGETSIFRWMPDGRFIIVAQGQEKVIRSASFGAFFWRVWFGLMSPVDRGSLVSRITFY